MRDFLYQKGAIQAQKLGCLNNPFISLKLPAEQSSLFLINSIYGPADDRPSPRRRRGGVPRMPLAAFGGSRRWTASADSNKLSYMFCSAAVDEDAPVEPSKHLSEYPEKSCFHKAFLKAILPIFSLYERYILIPHAAGGAVPLLLLGEGRTLADPLTKQVEKRKACSAKVESKLYCFDAEVSKQPPFFAQSGNTD